MPNHYHQHAHTHKGVTYEKGGAVASCLFCNFVNQTRPKPLIHDDHLCVAFLPKCCTPHPCAAQHLLVVSKKHIKTVDHLATDDAALAAHMSTVAHTLLAQRAVEAGRPPPPARRRARLLYHSPPFNSIDHLHLHALELPFRTFLHAFKYGDWACWCVTHAMVQRRIGTGAGGGAAAAAERGESTRSLQQEEGQGGAAAETAVAAELEQEGQLRQPMAAGAVAAEGSGAEVPREQGMRQEGGQ